MCIFSPRPLMDSIIFFVVACFFQLAILQKHQLSEAVTLGVAPLAASGSSLTWRLWLCVAAHPHKRACDWPTKCTHSMSEIELLEWARGSNVCTEIHNIFFFFETVNATCHNKEFISFRLKDFSLSLTSPCFFSATLALNEL